MHISNSVKIQGKYALKHTYVYIKRQGNVPVVVLRYISVKGIVSREHQCFSYVKPLNKTKCRHVGSDA